MIKAGIYNPNLGTRGGGERVSLAIAARLSTRVQPAFDVHFITHEAVDLTALGEYFDLDLSRVRLDVVPRPERLDRLLRSFGAPRRLRGTLADGLLVRQLRARSYGLFVNHDYQSNLPDVSPAGIHVCMFPQRLSHRARTGAPGPSLARSAYTAAMDALHRAWVSRSGQHAVHSYAVVAANSVYTARWIRSYWGLDSELLFPPCENMRDPAVEKRNVILNVGRFFGPDSAHTQKRQDALLEAFAGLAPLHASGWELHFAGSGGSHASARRSMDELRARAQGLPVHFHVDSSYQALRRLYNEARIYVHATGYGSDPETRPEKQEHFGISTVEAMSAGAVPVVFDGGGQRDIVRDGVDGYLWRDLNELRVKLSCAALDCRIDRNAPEARAAVYSRAVFDARLDVLVARALAEGGSARTAGT